MKLSEIKLSKTFSIVLLIIVASVFLLPVLSMNFMFWLAEQKERRTGFSVDEEIEFQVKTVKYSIEQLNIADPALLQCIREFALEQAQLPPNTYSSIEFVDELLQLNCSNKGITSIEGISALQKLKSLDLSENKLTRVDVLNKLDKLEELDISNNLVTDISSLTSLSKLTVLRFSGNQSENIKPLLAFAALETVYMPNMENIYCSDLEQVQKSARFVAHQNDPSPQCKGEYSSNIERIKAIRASGGILSPDDESVLLEYELNEMKQQYKQKYQ